MKLQWLRSRFHLVALVAALALGGASWLGAREYLAVHARRIEAGLAERHARTRVLVAGTDLESGAVLDAGALAMRDMPVRYVPSATARIDDLARVEGHRLAISLKAGDPVTWSALQGSDEPLFSAQLPAGRRAITVPVDDVNAIAGLLSPGDRIDLLYVDRRGAKPRVRPFLQQVLVLATGTTTAQPSAGGSASDQMPGPDGFATITLSVTPEEAQRLVLAQRTGELTAVLRHPRDERTVSTAAIESVIPQDAPRAARRPVHSVAEYVEIIVGGRTASGLAERTRAVLDAPEVAAQAAAGPSAATPEPRALPDAGNVRSRLGIAVSPVR